MPLKEPHQANLRRDLSMGWQLAMIAVWIFHVQRQSGSEFQLAGGQLLCGFKDLQTDPSGLLYHSAQSPGLHALGKAPLPRGVSYVHVDVLMGLEGL